MPLDYVARAVERGYREIGISDHGPLLDEWRYRMTNREFYEEYLPGIAEAEKQYGDAIKIYRGLEIEYHPGFHHHYERLRKDLDYLILEQHIIFFGLHYRDVYDYLTDEDIARYRDEVIAAMYTGYFKMIAHPDIYMFARLTWDKAADKLRAIIKRNRQRRHPRDQRQRHQTQADQIKTACGAIFIRAMSSGKW